MSTFDPVAVRASSWRQVEKEGLQSNPELPLLEPDLKIRQSVEAVGTRILCMHVAAAHAFDFPLDRARVWVNQEGLRGHLSPPELQFLSGKGLQYLIAMQMQVHSVYTLMWCASLVDEFSLHRKMPDDLIRGLPDLWQSESSGAFRARLKLRASEEILPQLDLAYCFNWAWRDARLSLKRLGVNREGLVEPRRKALEWIIRGGDWDDVPLDT